MDILANRSKSEENRANPLSAVLHTILGIVWWPIRFFMLTEAERVKAGIYVDGKGHDE